MTPPWEISQTSRPDIMALIIKGVALCLVSPHVRKTTSGKSPAFAVSLSCWPLAHFWGLVLVFWLWPSPHCPPASTKTKGRCAGALELWILLRIRSSYCVALKPAFWRDLLHLFGVVQSFKSGSAQSSLVAKLLRSRDVQHIID